MTHEQHDDLKKDLQKEKNTSYSLKTETDDQQNEQDRKNQDVSIEGQFQDRGHSHKKDNSKSREPNN